jgi:hypothetical protein
MKLLQLLVIFSVPFGLAFKSTADSPATQVSIEDLSGVEWVYLLYRGLSQHQDYRVLNMLPDGKPNEYEATIPDRNIDPHLDLMYMFQVMDNKGNGKIYPDLAKETPPSSSRSILQRPVKHAQVNEATRARADRPERSS